MWPTVRSVSAWWAALVPTVLVAGLACDGESAPSIVDLEVVTSPHCELVAIVSWRTATECSGLVRFGRDAADEFQVDEGSSGTEHRVIVVGMAPEDSYVLQAFAVDDQGREASSEPLAFETGAVPEPLQPLELDVLDADRAQAGWTVTNATTGLSSPALAVVLDMQGDIVWYHRVGDHDGLADVVATLADAEVLIGPGVPGGESPVVVDLAGETLWEGPEQVLCFEDGGMHHVFDRLDNGDYMLVAFALGEGVIGDVIREFDADGAEVWSWNTLDHLDPHPPWVHLNAVAVDLEGQALYANSYQMDQFYKIDRQSGEVLWTLGVNGDFEPPADLTDPWPSQAHGLDWLGDGHFLLYDNGTSIRGYTRVTEYVVDEAEGSVDLAWQYPGDLADDDWWSNSWGDADRLANGNTLINAGEGPGSPQETDSRIFEVTPDGEIVWQVRWANGDDVKLGSYAAQRVPAVARAL